MAKKKKTTTRRVYASRRHKFVLWQVGLGAVGGWFLLELVDEIPLLGPYLQRLRARGKPVNGLLFVILGSLAAAAYYARSPWTSIMTGAAGAPLIKAGMDKEASEGVPVTGKAGGAVGALLDAWALATADEQEMLAQLLPRQIRTEGNTTVIDVEATEAAHEYGGRIAAIKRPLSDILEARAG